MPTRTASTAPVGSSVKISTTATPASASVVTAPTPTPSSFDENADDVAAEHSRPPGARGQVLTYSSLPSLLDARARAQPVEPTRTHAPEPAAAASDDASEPLTGLARTMEPIPSGTGAKETAPRVLPERSLATSTAYVLAPSAVTPEAKTFPSAPTARVVPRGQSLKPTAPVAIALRVTSPVLGSISIAAGAPSSSVTPKAMNLPVLGTLATLCRRTVSSNAAAASADHAATPSARDLSATSPRLSVSRSSSPSPSTSAPRGRTSTPRSLSRSALASADGAAAV